LSTTKEIPGTVSSQITNPIIPKNSKNVAGVVQPSRVYFVFREDQATKKNGEMQTDTEKFIKERE
jgi:hypothetical protein